MGLSLSLGSDNWREEMWIEIFDRAKKKGKIVKAQVGKHSFQYALINPRDGYGRDRISTTGEEYWYIGPDVTSEITDAERDKQIGANYGGLAFVLQRSLARPDFADYVGLHEHIETLPLDLSPSNSRSTLGKKHGEACKAELEEVLKREDAFVDVYAAWVVGVTTASKRPEQGYFGRAIPYFLEVVLKRNLHPTQVLREFKRQLDVGYHLR